MTVPLAPNSNPAEVARIVEQELAALVALGGKSR